MRLFTFVASCVAAGELAVRTSPENSAQVQIVSPGKVQGHMVSPSGGTVDNTLEVRPHKAAYTRHVKRGTGANKFEVHSEGSLQVSTGDAKNDARALEDFVSSLDLDIPELKEKIQV